MPSEPSINHLSPDEAGEVLRRLNATDVRFTTRPSIEEVAERTGTSIEEVRRIVVSLRSLGAAINAPSGDLQQIRLEAQDWETIEEDPRALARVASEDTGIRMEGGTGKLPRATRIVLILAIVVFVGLVLVYVTHSPVRP